MALEITVDSLAKDNCGPDGREISSQNVSFLGKAVSFEQGPEKSGYRSYSAVIEDIQRLDADVAMLGMVGQKWNDFVRAYNGNPPGRITIFGMEDDTPITKGDGSTVETAYSHMAGALETHRQHPVTTYVKIRGQAIGQSAPHTVRAYYVEFCRSNNFL